MKELILADVRSQSYRGDPIGHYKYVSNLYLRLFGSICDVRIAGGPVYTKDFKRDNYLPLPYDAYDKEAFIKRYYRTLINCKHLFEATGRDDIILMHNSSVSTYLIGIILFAKRRNNIYAILYSDDVTLSRGKKFLFDLAKKQIKGILVPNNTVGKAYGLPYCVVPDYIFTGDIQKLSKASYNEKKYDFVILGGMYRDKCVVEAARKFEHTDYKVLIAGLPYDEYTSKELTRICGNNSNMELHLGLLPDKDYERYMNEARYCLLNYQGSYMHRSSGVVLDAMFHGVPVVGHRSFPLELAEKEKVGLVYDDISLFNPEEVLSQKRWNYYHGNIMKYLVKNMKYKDIIPKFLGLV